jgi:hypothetical protein
LNQEIKDKLIRYFQHEQKLNNSQSFKKFIGLWDDNDYQEFTEKTKDFEKISESDWNS